MLVFLGLLFTIILAGLDNTIASTVTPVALPQLGGPHLDALDVRLLHAGGGRIDTDLGTAGRIVGDVGARND